MILSQFHSPPPCTLAMLLFMLYWKITLTEVSYTYITTITNNKLKGLNPQPPCSLCHVIKWLSTGFGLVIRFIRHSYSLWLHFTNHYHAKTSILNHSIHCAAWEDLPTVDVPLLLGFTSYSSNSCIKTGFQGQSIGWSVKLLLAFTSGHSWLLSP
jgi:hypothetical protein